MDSSTPTIKKLPFWKRWFCQHAYAAVTVNYAVIGIRDRRKVATGEVKITFLTCEKCGSEDHRIHDRVNYPEPRPISDSQTSEGQSGPP